MDLDGPDEYRRMWEDIDNDWDWDALNEEGDNWYVDNKS